MLIIGPDKTDVVGRRTAAFCAEIAVTHRAIRQSTIAIEVGNCGKRKPDNRAVQTCRAAPFAVFPPARRCQ